MPFFRKKTSNVQYYKSRLEHKLYLARENPEPYFDLSDCALKDVPPGIYSLCKVFRKESLYLQDNHLTSLGGGGCLHDLAMLQVLNLHNNCLTVLPDSIGCLMNLRALNLNDNRLRALPENLGFLKRLISLEATNNQLVNIPVSVCLLPHLALLDVRGNVGLTLRKLPPAITQAPALETLKMDVLQLGCVPQDVVEKGTQSLLAFLAEENGLPYIPLEDREPVSDVDARESVNVFDLEKREHGFRAQRQQERLVLEMDRDELHQREFEACCAFKQSRGKLLADLAQQQSMLEREVERLQQEREQDRQRLIQHLQEAESNTDIIITQLLLLSAQERDQERVQEQLQREQEEEQELLASMQDQQRALQRRDVLDGMKILLEEECRREQRLREYEQCRSEMTRSLLSQELESSSILLNAVDRHSSAQMELVQRLQRDEELQRAAVCALLERGDARTWGLVQQVALVEQQLAQLTAIELQRRKHQLSEQLSDLSEKRVALSTLLLQLLDEQAARRQQLLHTLNQMESQAQDTTDFWLHQYQRLLDSRPVQLMGQERVLDPILANHLVLNGVVHCLPFLAQWVHDPDALSTVTDKQLKEAGIKSVADRQNVLRALELYAEERECALNKLCEYNTLPQPSAPIEEESEEAVLPGPSASKPCDEIASTIPTKIMESECVVCMEAVCDVIILPCGHMCCCASCCEPLNSCPMCRGDIERKIRVISP